MSAVHKRDYTPNELGEILSIVIGEYEQQYKQTYTSSDRQKITERLKALRQLQKQEELKSRNKQQSIL